MRIQIGTQLKNEVWQFVSQNNLGKRHSSNGTKTEQYVGMLGEVAVKRLFKQPVDLTAEFDGGFDFEHNEMKIDVKTMGRNVNPQPSYVNNFVAYQKDFKCDAYIFCSLNKKTSELHICGWVTKDELLDKAEKFKKGTERTRSDGSVLKLKAPTYEIKNSDLKPIDTLL